MIIVYKVIALYLLVLISSVLSTAFGVGSFVLIPIFTFFFTAKESVAMASLYFTFQNIVKLGFFWRFIDWNISKKLLLYGLPGTIAGSALLLYINISFFQKMLGIAILAYVVKDLLKLKTKEVTPAQLKPYQIPLFSFLYGVSSGVVGSGNAVKGPLFSSAGLTKETYVATYAATSFLLNIPKIFIYVQGGVISRNVLFESLPLLIVSLLGTYLGKKLISSISESSFTLIINVFFVFSAIALML